MIIKKDNDSDNNFNINNRKLEFDTRYLIRHPMEYLMERTIGF